MVDDTNTIECCLDCWKCRGVPKHEEKEEVLSLISWKNIDINWAPDYVWYCTKETNEPDKLLARKLEDPDLLPGWCPDGHKEKTEKDYISISPNEW